MTEQTPDLQQAIHAADERDHFQAGMHRMRDVLDACRQGRFTWEQANDEFFDGFQQAKQAFGAVLLARDIRMASPTSDLEQAIHAAKVLGKFVADAEDWFDLERTLHDTRKQLQAAQAEVQRLRAFEQAVRQAAKCNYDSFGMTQIDKAIATLDALEREAALEPHNAAQGIGVPPRPEKGSQGLSDGLEGQ
jgi:hypothetical protein